MKINNSVVATNDYNKTGSEVTDMRKEQMDQIENNNDKLKNQQQEQNLQKNKINNLGQSLDLFV